MNIIERIKEAREREAVSGVKLEPSRTWHEFKNEFLGEPWNIDKRNNNRKEHDDNGN